MSEHRKQQLEALLQRGVQQVLARGLSDPRVRGLVSVMGVDLSGDYKRATIRVSIMPEEHEELTMHGIRAAARHIRHEVGEVVDVRQMPEFRFELDRSLKKEAALLDSLARVRAERRGPDAKAPEGGDVG